MKLENAFLADQFHATLGGVRTLLKSILIRVLMVADEASRMEAVKETLIINMNNTAKAETLVSEMDVGGGSWADRAAGKKS